MAAIAELEEKNGIVVPATFPPEAEMEAKEEAYKFWNLSEGEQSAEGLWATGSAPDGTGDFKYYADPAPEGNIPNPTVPASEVHHDLDKELLKRK